MSPLMGRPPLEGRHLTGRAVLLMVAILLSAAPASELLAGSSWLSLTLIASAPVILGGILLRRLTRHQVLVPVLQVLVLGALVLAVEYAEEVIRMEDGPIAALTSQGWILRGGVEELAAGVPPMTLGPSGTVVVVLVIGLMALLLDLMFLDLGWHTPAGLLLMCSILLPALQQPGGGPWWTVAAPLLAGGAILATRTVHADPRYIQGDRRPQAGPLPFPGRTLGVTALCVALVAGLAPGLAGALPQLVSPRISLDIDVINAWQDPGARGPSPVMIDDDVSVRRSLLQQDDVEVLRYSTTDPDPSYLRVRTLNSFDGETFSDAADGEEPLAGSASFSDARDDGVSLRGSEDDLQDTTIELTDFGGDRLPVPDNVRSIQGQDPALTREMELQPTDGEVALTGSGIALAGQSYTVQSEEQTASAEQLRAVDPADFEQPFDAGYTSREEVPQVAQELAEEVSEDAGAETAYDAAIAYQEYFRTSFAYSLTVTSPPGQDPLESFLQDRVGYCEQFASAFALMMTSQGYPSRVVIGFTAGDEDGEERSVSSKNAHAWPEVWFGPEHGWVRFEPTPAAAANGVSTPEITEDTTAEESPAPEVAPTAAPLPEDPTGDEGAEAEEPTGAEDPEATDDSEAPVISGQTAQRVESGLLTALTIGVLVAGSGAAAVLLIRRRRLLAREERWAALTESGAGPDGSGGPGVSVADALALEQHRRDAGEMAWSEVGGELAMRRTAIRWLGFTGAWGRPPRTFRLDEALPPERALENLLAQIDAGNHEVSEEHRAAARRIASALTAARYAAPVGAGAAAPAAPAASAVPDGPAAPAVPGGDAPAAPAATGGDPGAEGEVRPEATDAGGDIGRGGADIRGGADSAAAAPPDPAAQHPLRQDTDLIIHLIRTAR